MTLVERAAEWPKQWLQEGIERGIEQGVKQGIEQGLTHERRSCAGRRRCGSAKGRRRGRRRRWHGLPTRNGSCGPATADELVARLMQLAEGRDTA